jgi:hypothetical protein
MSREQNLKTLQTEVRNKPTSVLQSTLTVNEDVELESVETDSQELLVIDEKPASVYTTKQSPFLGEIEDLN